MTTGAEALLDLRKGGSMPADPVAIYLDVPFGPEPMGGERQAEICIHPGTSIARLNLAGVVGCAVAVRVPEEVPDERIEALVERLAFFGADRVAVCRAWLNQDDERQLTVEVVEGKRV